METHPKLRKQALVEAHSSELGGAVVRAAVGAEQACHRAHRHDVPLAGLYHVGKERFYRLER